MPIVDLGVDFEEVKDSDKFEPMESGTYQFQVRNIKQGETGPNSKTPGRPMLVWECEIIDDPNYAGRRFFYNTVLPWSNPQTGERDDSAIGLLVGICKSIGKPWSGGALNTDELVGNVGQVQVGQGTIGAGPNKGDATNTFKMTY